MVLQQEITELKEIKRKAAAEKEVQVKMPSKYQLEKMRLVEVENKRLLKMSDKDRIDEIYK